MPRPEKEMSMNWYSKTGRSGLVRELMEKGMSVRKAEKAVNAVFAVMARSIRRGEEVETPLGMFLVKGQEGERRQEIHAFRNVNTGQNDLAFVVYRGRRRVVKLQPNENLDLTPLPVPPPPPTSEEIECRELAAELLGGRADDAVLKRLKQAAALPPTKPGNLRARLRNLKSRGLRYQYASNLAADVASLYWL